MCACRWLQEGHPVLWHSTKRFFIFDSGTVSILREEDAVQVISGSVVDPVLRKVASALNTCVLQSTTPSELLL
jgi:hypothetical protein